MLRLKAACHGEESGPARAPPEGWLVMQAADYHRESPREQGLIEIDCEGEVN